MAALAAHCLHHAQRPAVARCPICREAFCRECVIEHDLRLICARCLTKLSETESGERTSRIPLAACCQLLLALALLWVFFFWIGDALILIPSDFHDGVIWSKP
jgi:hypothetical protein